MIFPTNETWKLWGISHEAHKFFILRWEDIFNEYTFDSWQVRSSNIKSILSEISEAIEVVKKVHKYHHNIKSLIEEALKSIKNDVIIKIYFPFTEEYLTNLMGLYESNVRNENNKEIESVQRLVKVINDKLGTYSKRLFSHLKKIISNPHEQYKQDYYSLAMSLGIELANIGYSIPYLRDSLKLLLDPPSSPFPERFEKLLNQYSGKEHSFECYFHISLTKALQGLIRLRGYNFEIIGIRPSKFDSEEEKSFFDKDKHSVIVKVKIKSLDPYSAKHESEEILESFFAISKLYQPTKKFVLKNDLSLIKSPSFPDICIEEDNSRLTYLRDANNPPHLIAEFTSLLNRLEASDSNQLSASLQYHKLAVSAKTDEARLVNLWIAVESLVQDGGKNIIDRISTYLPKIITTNYVHSLTTAFIISFKELWRCRNTRALRNMLSSTTTEIYIDPIDILTILTNIEDGDLISNFLSFCGEHSLLVFRAYSLWNNFFKDPGTLEKALSRHCQNIEWQLRRIYRVRNQIMHRGTKIRGGIIRQLIQHLHSYYIVTIHNLLHDLKQNDSWNIGDSFEHRSALYNYFNKILKTEDGNSICIESLNEPSLSLINFSGIPAWKFHQKKQEK